MACLASGWRREAGLMAAGPRERDRAAWLRRDAERISGALPPLLVEAERLVASAVPGVHGRRRSGPGETFWQYRAAYPGDTLSAIDWRRSARSDRLYVREMEWEAAETVAIWCDRSRAMDFQSKSAPRSKGERARLLALALCVLLSRGDERFGLLGTEAEPPSTGETQLARIGAILSHDDDDPPDFGTPPAIHLPRISKAVFLSDFMGPDEAVLPRISDAAGRGVGGVILQVLDPEEESFPYLGRTRFESPGRTILYDTDEAAGLRGAYLHRLSERREWLAALARRAGWRLILHSTNESPRKALLALYAAIGGV